ncbi:AMP-binding enzyme [Metarhizium robertsii]|uniref:AMP-binding enzyme n=1 Tax=Metarhizium robertsii TaxID=568076 RepID=A0A0A1UQK2_9HYPO|nr:AMP-binding enzyme [Metarhizium robertsii]
MKINFVHLMPAVANLLELSALPGLTGLTLAGCVGELVVSGPTLARGYLNDAAKTNAAFITYVDLIAKEKDNILYKTGDLARFDFDGNVEMMGREESKDDGQIKLNDLRIELGEIEKAKMLPSIFRSSSCCRCKNSLLAHPSDMFKRAISKAAHRLQNNLPQYMVPNLWTPVCSWPPNATGKTDKRRLASAAEAQAPAKMMEYLQTTKADGSSDEMEMKNRAEEVLEDAWKQVLNRQDGVTYELHDDFFAVGGDSHTTIRLISLLKAKGAQVTAQDIFGAKTLRNMAIVISIKNPGYIWARDGSRSRDQNMNGVTGAANEGEMPPVVAMETGIEDSSAKNGAAPITAGSSSTSAYHRFLGFNKLAPLLRCAIPSSEQVFISSAMNSIKHTIQQCNDEADCFWREKLEGSALTSISCDVTFGNLVSGRYAAFQGAQEVVGPCRLNVIPFRVRIDTNQCFGSLLKDAYHQGIDTIPFEATPFNRIAAQSPWPSAAGFHSMFQFQNIPGRGDEDQILPGSVGWTKLGSAVYGGGLLQSGACWLTAWPSVGGTARFLLRYSEETMETGEAEAVMDLFVGILRLIHNNPEASVASVSRLYPPAKTIQSHCLVPLQPGRPSSSSQSRPPALALATIMDEFTSIWKCFRGFDGEIHPHDSFFDMGGTRLPQPGWLRR